MRKLGLWMCVVVGAALAAGCATSTTPGGAGTAAAPSASCSKPEPAPSGKIVLSSGGLERTYLLSLPDPLPTVPAPVIFDLHGAGSNAQQQVAYSGMSAAGTARGFVVVTPDATGEPEQQWNVAGQTHSDDVAFINDLITDVAARACIDEGRLFATGLSSGAVMSSLLACKEGERFRAIAPVAGIVSYLGCDEGPPVSVVAFHGTADPVLHYEGGTIGGGIPYPGVPHAMAGWVQRDRCEPTPERVQVSTHVTLDRYVGCGAGTSLELYTIVGGGHSWPGAFPVPFLGPTTDEISATDIILDFFSR